jgi:hypothetical protein
MQDSAGLGQCSGMTPEARLAATVTTGATSIPLRTPDAPASSRNRVGHSVSSAQREPVAIGDLRVFISPLRGTPPPLDSVA